MNAYFVGITQQEKNNILDQHKKIYDGYRIVQQTNTQPQPLYVQDFANDKEGFVVNNSGDVKKYTNMGINESLYEAIEIVAVSDYGVSNWNKREYTRKHKKIVDILSNPEEWTDDLVFKAKDGNVYHIDELIDKDVKVGKKTITVVEVAEYSDYPNALELVNEADDCVECGMKETYEDMDMSDGYAYRDDMINPEADEIDYEDLIAASKFYDDLKSGKGQKPSDKLNDPTDDDQEDNNWMFVEDEFTESEDLDESFHTQRNKILEMFQRTSRF